MLEYPRDHIISIATLVFRLKIREDMRTRLGVGKLLVRSKLDRLKQIEIHGAHELLTEDIEAAPWQDAIGRLSATFIFNEESRNMGWLKSLLMCCWVFFMYFMLRIGACPTLGSNQNYRTSPSRVRFRQ